MQRPSLVEMSTSENIISRQGACKLPSHDQSANGDELKVGRP